MSTFSERLVKLADDLDAGMDGTRNIADLMRQLAQEHDQPEPEHVEVDPHAPQGRMVGMYDIEGYDFDFRQWAGSYALLHYSTKWPKNRRPVYEVRDRTKTGRDEPTKVDAARAVVAHIESLRERGPRLFRTVIYETRAAVLEVEAYTSREAEMLVEKELDRQADNRDTELPDLTFHHITHRVTASSGVPANLPEEWTTAEFAAQKSRDSEKVLDTVTPTT